MRWQLSEHLTRGHDESVNQIICFGFEAAYLVRSFARKRYDCRRSSQNRVQTRQQRHDESHPQVHAAELEYLASSNEDPGGFSHL